MNAVLFPTLHTNVTVAARTGHSRGIVVSSLELEGDAVVFVGLANNQQVIEIDDAFVSAIVEIFADHLQGRQQNGAAVAIVVDALEVIEGTGDHVFTKVALIRSVCVFHQEARFWSLHKDPSKSVNGVNVPAAGKLDHVVLHLAADQATLFFDFVGDHIYNREI